MAKITNLYEKEWVKTIEGITFELFSFFNEVNLSIFKTKEDQYGDRYPGYYFFIPNKKSIIGILDGESYTSIIYSYTFSCDPIFYMSGEDITLSLSSRGTDELKNFIKSFMMPTNELREKIINEL